MPQGTELRQKASLYRRMASVPTEGGRREDRVLLVMADRLEREAAELDDRLRQQDTAVSQGRLRRRPRLVS